MHEITEKNIAQVFPRELNLWCMMIGAALVDDAFREKLFEAVDVCDIGTGEISPLLKAIKDRNGPLVWNELRVVFRVGETEEKAIDAILEQLKGLSVARGAHDCMNSMGLHAYNGDKEGMKEDAKQYMEYMKKLGLLDEETP